MCVSHFWYYYMYVHVFVSFVPRQGMEPEVCIICVLPRGVSDI